MTDTYFQLRYIQTSSRNAVNKKLFLTSLLFLACSYRDVQHTNYRQKPISVASQEKKSQIATLATDSVIPAYSCRSHIYTG
jgi:hypothetical protein